MKFMAYVWPFPHTRTSASHLPDVISCCHRCCHRLRHRFHHRLPPAFDADVGGVVGLCCLLYKVPKVAIWWGSNLLAPALLVLYFIQEMFKGSALRWPDRSAAENGSSSSSTKSKSKSKTKRASDGQAAAVAAAAAVPLDLDQDEHNGTAPGQTAGNSGRVNGSDGERAQGISKGDKKYQKQAPGLKSLLPIGTWWPKSFGPADLAAFSHWYANLIGWHFTKW